MTKSEILDAICIAINTISKKLVDDAPYDSTLAGFISAIVDEDEGIYKVKYQNANYTTMSVGGVKYKVGDKVYILIPQNDRTQTIFILGKATD